MGKRVAAMLVALVCACNSDSTSPGIGILPGNYVLQTANAKPVPALAIQDASGRYEVLRGNVILRDDLTFVDSLVDRFTAPGGNPQQGTEVRQGTYIQTGDNVSLTYEESPGTFKVYSLTWINGNTLVYAEDALSLIYRK